MVIIKCGICKNVRVRGRWMEPDSRFREAIISYACCPECRQRLVSSGKSPAQAVSQLQKS